MSLLSSLAYCPANNFPQFFTIFTDIQINIKYYQSQNMSQLLPTQIQTQSTPSSTYYYPFHGVTSPPISTIHMNHTYYHSIPSINQTINQQQPTKPHTFINPYHVSPSQHYDYQQEKRSLQWKSQQQMNKGELTQLETSKWNKVSSAQVEVAENIQRNEGDMICQSDVNPNCKRQPFHPGQMMRPRLHISQGPAPLNNNWLNYHPPYSLCPAPQYPLDHNIHHNSKLQFDHNTKFYQKHNSKLSLRNNMKNHQEHNNQEQTTSKSINQNKINGANKKSRQMHFDEEEKNQIEINKNQHDNSLYVNRNELGLMGQREMEMPMNIIPYYAYYDMRSAYEEYLRRQKWAEKVQRQAMRLRQKRRQFIGDLQIELKINIQQFNRQQTLQILEAVKCLLKFKGQSEKQMIQPNRMWVLKTSYSRSLKKIKDLLQGENRRTREFVKGLLQAMQMKDIILQINRGKIKEKMMRECEYSQTKRLLDLLVRNPEKMIC